MLTAAQVEQFRALGFVVVRQQLQPTEVEQLRSEMRSAMGAAYAHSPFDGTRRHWLPMMGPDTPIFASLLEDPRFLDAAEELMGGEALGWMVDANRYVGDTPWHHDAFATAHGVKWAIYLEPVGADTGALRLIPASHHPAVNAQVGKFIDLAGRADLRVVPALALDSQPGDVVAFDFRCWHASVGGGTDRSMLTVEYFARPQTEQQGDDLRTVLESHADMCDKLWGDRVGHPFLEPRWAAEPLSPRRKLLVDRLRGCGLLTGLATS